MQQSLSQSVSGNGRNSRPLGSYIPTTQLQSAQCIDFYIRCRRVHTPARREKQPNWRRRRRSRRRPDNYHDYIRTQCSIYTLWALEAINTHNPLYGSQRLVYAYYRDIDIHFSQHIFIYLFEKNSKKENGLEAVWEMEPPPPSLCNVVMKRDLCVKTFSKGKKCSQ